MDKITKEKRSWNMSRIKSKNTSPERKMFEILKERGIKFIKHRKNLPGKPDIIIPSSKLAVFIDGEFWHGKDFTSWKEKLSDFWLNKITVNIKRDRKNRKELRILGWKIVRFWGKSIIKNPNGVVNKIEKLIRQTYF